MRFLLPLLVRLFPRPFREAFGDEVAEQARDGHARARSRGRGAALRFTVATAWDLLQSAVAERFRPTWTGRTDERKPGGGEGMMGAWSRDFAYAARALSRTPGFAAVTVVTLGLAVGANAGIFSVLSNVVLRPLPFQEPDRLIAIAASAPGSDFPEEFGVSAEFYVQYREQATLLEDVSTYNSFTASLRVGDRVERVRMSWPTLSLFNTLRVTPILGRLPVPEDEDGVALISHQLWTTWFGADPDVIGRSYEMIGRPRTVIGVMGPEFRFPDDGVRLWIPNQIDADGVNVGRFGIRLVARMAPGVEHEDVVEQLRVLARRLPERFGGSPGYARLLEQHRPVVRSLRAELLGDVSRPLWVLMGAVVLVLMIACANVANLFTVRVESRQRDLAVRRALGAGRRQLIRTQMAESLLLALVGGALGVILARVGTPVLVVLSPELPRGHTVSVDVATLAFTLGVSLLAALACGLAPAVRAASPSLQRLRDAGRGATRRRHWARDGLVVAQTALALVLLVGSGLLVRSFWHLAQVDPGYDTEDLFTFQIAPEGEPGLDDGPSFARFHMAFMDRVRALPGVESVGVVENLPLDEGTRSGRFLTEDQPAEVEDGYLIRYTWAGGDYFATHGVDVLVGRAFARADHESEPGNAVISETTANLLWPGLDPIGRRIQFRDSEEWHTVVGVVEDVKQLDLRETPDPLIYLPLVGPSPDSWSVVSPAYVVKTTRAEEIAPEIRALVRELAPSAPMYAVHTMSELRADSIRRLSFTMLTLAMASGLALLMGSIGLYGVLSYVVALRTQEIGVRMALGARTREVRRMVVAQGARVVGVGIVLGLLIAAATTRVLGALLFDTAPLDGPTFTAVGAVMASVGLLASYLPARRASNLDPVISLRAE